MTSDQFALVGVALLAGGIGILAGGMGIPDRVLSTGIAWAGSVMFFAIARHRR
jgi:hypothetical protein